jgi:hypothetical protein
MTTLHLMGRITENGELEVKLPEGLPPVEVKIDMTLPVQPEELPWEERPWTEEEIQEMLKSGTPLTGAEIVKLLEEEGGWEHMGITDGAEWVEELRRKEQERRNTRW